MLSLLDSTPPDAPSLPHFPTLFQQLRVIDQQNPDQWPDPDSSGEALVNFQKLRLGIYKEFTNKEFTKKLQKRKSSPQAAR